MYFPNNACLNVGIYETADIHMLLLKVDGHSQPISNPSSKRKIFPLSLCLSLSLSLPSVYHSILKLQDEGGNT